jgi:hypothetical protein
MEILKIASPRDRAFFTIIAQSGLRPSTVASLKLKDIEGILTGDTPVPCLIRVRQKYAPFEINVSCPELYVLIFKKS